MAYVYTPDGDHRVLGPDEFDLASMQRIVGGFIEGVAAKNPEKMLFVNEDGRRLNLPMNIYASRVAGQPILGTVIFGRRSEFENKDDQE